MGFGGHVTIDTAGTAEPLYQNVKGTNITTQVSVCQITADENNGGNIMLGPFREVSAADPRYGTFLLDAGQTARIKSDGSSAINLEEWWVDTDNATDQVYWSVAHGTTVHVESAVI